MVLRSPVRTSARLLWRAEEVTPNSGIDALSVSSTLTVRPRRSSNDAALKKASKPPPPPRLWDLVDEEEASSGHNHNQTKLCEPEAAEESSSCGFDNDYLACAVRFDTTRNISYAPPADLGEMTDRWYAAPDFVAFRTATLELAKGIVEMDNQAAAANNNNNSDTAGVQESNKDDNDNNNIIVSSDPVLTADDSYKGCLSRLFAACVRARSETDAAVFLSAVDSKALRQWLQISVTRVGLERLLLTQVMEDKQHRYALLLQRVKEVQALDFTCPLVRQQTLRLACERVSRPARLFAREMATAMMRDPHDDWCDALQRVVL